MIYPSNVDEIVTDHRQPVSALFVASRRLFALALRSAVNQDRSILVNALLSCTGLLNGVMIEQARPATIEELRQYHDLPYLVALANCLLLSPRQLAAHGLQGDCPPFPDLLEFASICAGGSLQAADALASERTRLAVHLDGGRHHARRALAAGFCYVNDVVLAILRLLDTFERVLYVDIDVHHGDAVEEAFFSTDRVLTLSMHRCDPGFFPGTGQMGTGGEGPGRGFALNLSLAEGLRDDLFCAAFERLATGAVRVFRPHCVVLQCGCDGLAGDPIAQSWSLTPAAFNFVGQQAAAWGVPLLVLGGGGYDSAAAARAWAQLMAGLLDRSVPADVPEHEFLDRYGPQYSMLEAGKPVLAPDGNNPAKIESACAGLLSGLEEVIEARQLALKGSGVACKRTRTQE